METVPVLFVGGGPIGLALAAELGWRGIRCLLIEQTDSTIYHPRATAENARTMEFCRRWGIAEAVRAVATPPDYPHTVVYATDMNGYEIARIERPHHGGLDPTETSPERPQRCNQIFFDPVLRACAEGLPTVRLRYSCRFESFEQDADGVTAIVTDVRSGATERIRARYLVACCGGHSPIGRTLGMAIAERPVLGYPINVFFKTPALWRYHRMGKAAIYFLVQPEGVWASIVTMDGHDLWRLGIQGTKTFVDAKTIDPAAMLRRAMGRDVPFEILNVLGWVRRNHVVERFRFGRVFLAGDCAHQNSPSGGFGLNTGMGDAVDLGWKLAAVIDGWGGEGLLESYEIERRPVALRNVAASTRSFLGHGFGDIAEIAADTPEGARQRAAVGAKMMAGGREQFVSDGIALGYRYEASPVVVPDGTEEPPDPVKDYTPTSRPGHRAPHAWLAPGRSTLDLFGRGFTLLRFGGTDDGLADAARRRRVPLAVYDIAETAIAALYERRYVLVRPDGHVAWRGDDPPADPVVVIDRVRGARK
jgi:2-polyprenyl-6-methoxyphenol hydroxylase-like FAD-dependent oxidoreductase